LRQLNQSEIEKFKKILVIQLGPFGDGLLTTSYFELLKKRIPNVKIYYLIKEPYQKVVLNHPYIDNIIMIKRLKGLRYFLERIKTFRRIRREKFDLVIDQQNMPSSQQFTLLSGAKYRLGYADARFHMAYNLKAKRRHIQYSASRKFDILEPLNIDEEPYKLYFNIGDKAFQYIDNWLQDQKLNPLNLICISPASPVLNKQWKLTNFAELADLIYENTKHEVLLLWGPKEKQQVDFVQQKMKNTPITAPPTTLNQAAALLKKCKLLICNDGGLDHLSVTTETPTLAIFGNTDPTDWSPASKYDHHFHLYVPEFDSGVDSSFGISPEKAFSEVLRILDLKLS